MSNSPGKALESQHRDPISDSIAEAAGQLILFAQSAFHKKLF
ncbi:MAG: hypothetical protein VX536_02255 [Pseudomonadota bacterium]|nr:hypothetical protein [Pseudomonadota bacterium]MEC8804097.1 hypothetical protein [Pseudomonadota bacterium]